MTKILPLALAPVWEGMVRADGSHPARGEVDIVRAEMGKGDFRGRYLRISTDSPVPFSPQLAEVEVYETRRPEVIAALADGVEIPVTARLELPPGSRRLSLRLRIPQSGMPQDLRFRWRLRGDLETWQDSHLMNIEMPCPPPGKITFEAQALHSDGQWDASVYRLPVIARQHLWETGVFRWLGGGAIVLSAVGLGILGSRRRTARKLARMKAETALANERSRIARDIHDDLGVSLTQIAMQCEVMEDDFDHPEQMRQHVAALSNSARAVTRAVDEIVWAVTPGNDTLEKFTAFIGQFVQNGLRPTGLACRLALPAELPPIPDGGHRAPSSLSRHPGGAQQHHPPRTCENRAFHPDSGGTDPDSHSNRRWRGLRSQPGRHPGGGTFIQRQRAI